MQQNDTKRGANSFGDYIAYVDESGDHSLTSINPHYPMFVLTFCIFQKTLYTKFVCPTLQRFKFQYFGHDLVVLHGREIVKRQPPFEFLSHLPTQERFFSHLNALIYDIPFSLIAVAVNKQQYLDSCDEPEHIYHLALRYRIVAVNSFLLEHCQYEKLTHIVFERRGSPDDDELEAEFRETAKLYKGLVLKSAMAHKASNTYGLQIADLVSRPIGRYILNPAQPNRAMDILRTKFRRGSQEALDNPGLIILT